MIWEYKTLKLDTGLNGAFDESWLEKRLNYLGEAEWELVAAFDTNAGLGATREVFAILKRPRM